MRKYIVAFLKYTRLGTYFRSSCLVANLAFCNCITSLGFLAYSSLLDIFYDIDSFNTLIQLNVGTEYAIIWPFAKVRSI